jgi:hypothetical protein
LGFHLSIFIFKLKTFEQTLPAAEKLNEGYGYAILSTPKTFAEILFIDRLDTMFCRALQNSGKSLTTKDHPCCQWTFDLCDASSDRAVRGPDNHRDYTRTAVFTPGPAAGFLHFRMIQDDPPKRKGEQGSDGRSLKDSSEIISVLQNHYHSNGSLEI